jgi:Tol biopolymer transport system component
VTTITDGRANDQVPQWSPDGRRILYFSDRSGKNQIHAMDARGRDARQLTRDTTVAAVAASWSPDGARIAFVCERGDSTEIEVMNVDGSSRAVVPGTGSATGMPVWSPDGKQIAFHAAVQGRNEIFVVSLAGGRPVRLTRGSEGRLE